MKRKENGITLIALIVTIIVMLILASITVATLTGRNSVITRAENAKNVTEQSQLDENKTIGDYEDYINQWTNNLTQPDNPVTPPADEPEGGTEYNLADKAEIGQYVNYDPTTGGNVTEENTKYTSEPGSATEHGNGYTTDADGQTFSAQAYKNSGGKWQILDIDESGNITLISDVIYQDTIDDAEKTVMGTEGLYISNGVGYIYAEEELHRIASIYGHGKGANTNQTVTYYYGGLDDQDGSIAEIDADGDGVIDNLAELQQGRKATLSLNSGARALTVDDVNKICGKTYKADYHFGDPVTITYYSAEYYPSINGTSSTGLGVAQSTFTGSYYNTSYDYTIESANNDTDAQTKQNAMLKNGKSYWLASRCVAVNLYDASFLVRFVLPIGDVNLKGTLGLQHGGVYPASSDAGVRAVVNLKPEIQTGDTEYDSTTGWNLVD